MKCRRIPLEAEVFPYELEQGLEDGFELFSNVVTREWTVNHALIKITREDGSVVCPYITHRRGRTFIEEGDYIIKDSDGTKHICGADKIFNRYERI